MSQEHRFCAEIYARLFSLIDRSKQIVVNPDGQARLPDCAEGTIPPDLCFTFCGMNQQVRIEAKIVQDKRDVKLEDSQRAWCANASGSSIPHLWMVATRTLEKCWLFEHGYIAKRSAANQGALINLWPNIEPHSSCNLDELALKIITWATKNLVQPEDVK